MKQKLLLIIEIVPVVLFTGFCGSLFLILLYCVATMGRSR